MAKAIISKTTVDDAQPASAEYVLWDDGGRETVKGFGMKVTPAGRKVFIFRYRMAQPGKASSTPPRKITLGTYGSMTPDQARKRAKLYAGLVASGIDPIEQDRAEKRAKEEAERVAARSAELQNELLFEKIGALWLRHYEREKRRSLASVAAAKLAINKHLAAHLTGKPLPSITRSDLRAAFDALPVDKVATRRNVFAYASVFFGWAVANDYIDQSPLAGMVKPQLPEARDRVLSDTELADIWAGSLKIDEPFGAFFRLLILSGQRRSEVAGIKWDELDRPSGIWTIPAARAKNRTAHIVPLSPASVAEFDAIAERLQRKAKAKTIDPANWPAAGAVLSTRKGASIAGFSKAKATLDTTIDAIRKERGEAELDAWRVHDLRRTLATGLQRLGVRFEVTEAVLNHVSGARSGVAGIYQRHDWKDEKRSALDAWARHVAEIVKPASKTNVVPLRRRKGSA